MRVIRNSTNTKIMIEVCNEQERKLMAYVLARGMNTLEPMPEVLLDLHEQVRCPLSVIAAPIPARAE